MDFVEWRYHLPAQKERISFDTLRDAARI